MISSKEKIKYVDPFIGNVGDEQSVTMHGGGKTHPGACFPGGMVQLCADTITGGDNGTGYNYCNSSVEGFSFNRLSGVGWYGDLGNFQIMPAVGDVALRSGTNAFFPLKNGGEGWCSAFSHKSEWAEAGYYAVSLLRYNIKAEATVSEHTGLLRLTYPESSKSKLIFNLSRRIGGKSDYQYLKIVDNRHFEGYIKCSPKGGGFGAGDGHIEYTLYFYCQVSKPFEVAKFFSNEEILGDFQCCEGEDIGLLLEFSTQNNEEIIVKTGISYVDAEGARNNFIQEARGRTFDLVREETARNWENAFSRIRAEGENETDLTLFYTCLYHTLLDPRTAIDCDGRYLGADGKIHNAQGYKYRTVFSGWDVYRSEFPLLTLLRPDIVNDEINSLLDISEKRNSGLPRWELMGIDSHCMVGDPAVLVAADAYVKGIRNYDCKAVYERARATCLGYDRLGNKISIARQCPDFVSEMGFIPLKLSATLEELFAEYALYRFADAMGEKADADYFKKRSARYEENFNPETGFMGPRDENGKFLPLEDGEYDEDGCVESNIYQQSWFMFQDVKRLIELFGAERFEMLLERFFERADFSRLWNDDYNHSNEPCHNVTHLFNYLGLPQRTQYWTRRVQKEAYRKGAYGFCGNEDVGQLSAWFVISSMGFAQLCPAVKIFNLNSPLFKKVSLTLDEKYHSRKIGEEFTVECDCDPLENPYIDNAFLNGEELFRAYLTYEEITDGGKLFLVMSKVPSKKFGKNELPPSGI